MTAKILPFAARPPITLTHELHELVAAAIKALAYDASVYQREGQLVRVVHLDADTPDGGITWLRGSPQIRPLAPATLRVRLAEAARWQRFDGRSKDLVSCNPPDDVVHAVHAQAEYEGLRHLVGILETPSMRPDGSLLDVPGYDRATGYIYEPSASFLSISPRATQEEACAAYLALREVFCDFPFAVAYGVDVCIAAVLSLLARPMILGAVPMFVFDASTRGSGKSLLADVCAMIATGRGAPRMNWPTQEEELDKCLGAVAIRGGAVVNLDNVSRPLGGATLDRCLTAVDRVELRVLGRSEIMSLRWRTVVLASGNNTSIVGDTTRRVLLARLAPDREDPENRTDFAHPDLLAWIGRERPRLVAAALTMLAAWVHAGRPGARTWGSFECWAATVPPCLAFAGGGDVLAARPARDEGHDTEASAILALLGAVERLDVSGRGITARDIIGHLYPQRERGDHAPDGYDDARDAIEQLARAKPGTKPTAPQLGYALRKQRDRILNGKRLRAVDVGKHTQGWSVA